MNQLRQQQKIRWIATFTILGILLLCLFAGSICIGSIKIPLTEAFRTIFSGGGDPLTRSILFDLRLPRALAALILGGALALAGYLLQTFFHNPLAGPFVLGISSGAKLIVALCMVFSLSHSFLMTSWHSLMMHLST